jgi:drug/metabolite transporter (DMT)-like permease
VRWNLALAALAVSWGLVAVLAGAISVDPIPLAFFRLVIAAITLALVALATGHVRLLRPERYLPALVALGCVQAVHWVLFFETVRRGSVALAVITFASAPVFLAVLAPAFLPEQLSRVAVAALVPGLAGITLVALAGGEGGSFGWAAVACGMGSALTFAILLILSKALLHAGAQPLTVAFWDCLGGSLVLAPALLFVAGSVPESGEDWAALILLGAVLTGFATLAYAALLRHVTAQTAGVLTFLEPVSAVILAWWLLEQPISPQALIGGALVLCAGIVVVVRTPTDGGVSEAVAGIGSAER